MAIGDASGQMTIIEVPKLFAEPSFEEEKMMVQFFDNEIQRQAYMDLRYKSLDEEMHKQEEDNIKGERDGSEKDIELRYAEDAFLNEKLKIMEELGMIVLPKVDKEEKNENKK
jgi:hypothetical protein